MRSLPCVSTWFTADAPALRSMAMQLASTHPHPTKGIQRISRFMTQTRRGNRIMIPKVSHVEECFMKITWLPSGRFSRPSTVKWMPHKTRAAKKNHARHDAREAEPVLEREKWTHHAVREREHQHPQVQEDVEEDRAEHLHVTGPSFNPAGRRGPQYA
jgi:hypothetical protein